MQFLIKLLILVLGIANMETRGVICFMVDRKLLGFTRIVETKSYSAAADSLFISQSALSQQIKLLEHQLGFELFDHKSRQAKLTRAGELFYPKAVQLLALYNDAVKESVYVSNAVNVRKQQLRLASHHELYFQLWQDILPLANDIGTQYAPFFTRYEDRLSMLRAIQVGESDLCVEIENADVNALGLNFTPFASIHELCIHTKGMPPNHSEPYLSLSELSQYVLAFHNMPGQTVFEDSLRAHLRKDYPNTVILEPNTFHAADFEDDIFILVPSVLVPNPQIKGAIPLEWGENLRVGFVSAPNCSAKIFSYAEHIMSRFSQYESPWI
ncbi:MAG: LysR family transcriptional regulator [Bacteroidia bacterium]|nr:LysR family transcriptional regulator [Bacteroidia bacterium]